MLLLGGCAAKWLAAGQTLGLAPSPLRLLLLVFLKVLDGFVVRLAEMEWQRSVQVAATRRVFR